MTARLTISKVAFAFFKSSRFRVGWQGIDTEERATDPKVRRQDIEVREGSDKTCL
jgi:hypothetical protein